jgi:two-component system sensor histidine kinase PilS (NtrC family)
MTLARAMRARLAWIIAVRLIVASLLLGAGVVIGRTTPDTLPAVPFVGLIGLTYLLSLINLALLRPALRRPVLVDLQFAMDAVLVSACIYITGGIASDFSSLYVLPIIAASTVRGRRGAVGIAALSATLYVGIVASQYLDIAPPLDGRWRLIPEMLPVPLVTYYTVAVNLGGMAAVALLTGSLAERLRSARAGLEDASYEIADLRAFNEHVIDALPAGLITTDADYRILTFNRAASRITGVAAAAAQRRDLRDLLGVNPEIRAVLPVAAEDRRRIELTYERSGDGRRDLGLTISTLLFPEGTSGFLAVFQDITEFKRLEREARLQQKLSAVGDMAAGLAHEIRNPLASMVGSIELLRDELPLTADHRQLLDIVMRESERLNETIRLFLAYAHPQRQAPHRLDVRQLLHEAADALRASVETRGDHVIEVDVADEPMWHDGDEAELRQLLWSLGTNGLRAMADRGRLRLAARLDDAGGHGTLVLTVSDEGCGIPADQLEAVFQPFRSTFRKGTGLGLSIVHRIVSDHGGTVDVSSAVGTGTTVTVRLPLRPAAPEPLVLPHGRTA